MRRTLTRVGVVATLATVLSLFAVVGAASAADGGQSGDGTRLVGPEINFGRIGLEKPQALPMPRTFAAPRAAVATATPPIGTQRIWMGLDDVAGQYFFTFYTLRGVGENIEVWVQNNVNFPAGDCRNGPRTTVTDEQIAYFIDEFDTNIYPKESAAFSVPPARDGSDAQLPGLLGQPNGLGITPEYYQGDGENIVTLISNVRDSNYYDTNNANANSFIAGFFSSQLTSYFGRNVMTIDAFDWLHRTGATPPDEPIPGDLCNSAPARPHSYEGVFAHEYQHLLESDTSPGELSWINEGLSDYAISLVGYGAPEKSINEIGFESHVQCFYGWLNTQTQSNPNPNLAGGPENSLTLWGDQGDDEILCDYGAAWTFMLWIQSHYGDAFLTALHNQPLNGMAGLQATLDQFLTGKSALDVIHAWAASVAVDAAIDASNPLARRILRDFQVTPLHASVNWANPEAYGDPGVPPNGSDYVRLRDAAGNFISAGKIKSLSFQGAQSLAADPIEWTLDDGALFSGEAVDEMDRTIVREVTVPAADPTLTFSAKFNMEELWDFGFVQVSTDAGETFTSLACSNTTSDHDPGAYPTVVANVPGYTGVQEDYRAESCDLSAYAGQTVALAFRAVTDWAFTGNGIEMAAGWWVKDVAVGGAVVSDGSSLAGWQSLTEYNPYPVAWTVQLVGTNSSNRISPVVVRLPVKNGQLSVSLGKVSRLLGALLGNKIDTVAAIVTFDDVSEGARKSATYTLTVNGVVQPGGGS